MSIFLNFLLLPGSPTKGPRLYLSGNYCTLENACVPTYTHKTKYTRNSNTQHLEIPFHHRKLPEASGRAAFFSTPNDPHNAPSWEPETESGGIKSTFLLLTRTFLVVDQKRIKWNNFNERRPGQQGVRVQKPINCWCLLNISGIHPYQKPCPNLSLYKIWSLKQSCGMPVWSCVCIYVCIHLCVCKRTTCQTYRGGNLSTLFLRQGLLIKPGTHQLTRLVGQLTLGICLSLPFQHCSCRPMMSGFAWVLETQTHVFMIMQKVLYWLNNLSSFSRTVLLPTYLPHNPAR